MNIQKRYVCNHGIAQPNAEATYSLVRSRISHLKDDRILHHYINRAGIWFSEEKWFRLWTILWGN